MKTVLVAGGFDPLHIGHIQHFKEAKALGDVLVVAVNSDADMVRKKGYCFMPHLERMEIIKAIKYVDRVIPVIDSDGSCAATIMEVRPEIFAKGGDRNPKDNPIPQNEIDACNRIGCEIVYGIGGGKVQSSSALTNAVLRKH